MEEFKDIAGWEGFYQISNYGRIKSLERFAPIRYRGGRMGKIFVPERIKATTIMQTGYEFLRLWNAGSSKFFLVHRLVAMTFIPNPENKRFVNHKDGNPSNNRLDNLEWCTTSENMLHAFKYLGRQVHNKGKEPHESHFAIKVKSIDDHGIERLFDCITYAAKFHNVDGSMISKVLRGKFQKTKGVNFQYQLRE